MPKHKRPLNFRDAEMQRYRTAWTKAREGDAAAKEELLQRLSTHKSIEAFIRYWQKMKDMAKPGSPTFAEELNRPSKPSKSKNQTPWERARSTLTTGPVRVVGGGLPSLGKRSR